MANKQTERKNNNMKLFGKEIRLFTRERFKAVFDIGHGRPDTKRSFWHGERSWTQTCNKLDQMVETHGLAKQALETIAGQLTAEGVFLEAAYNEGPHQASAENAMDKCQELMDRIGMPLMFFDTATTVAKYGSCFWEKSLTPIFDVRVVPMQESMEPAEVDMLGTISKWRQNIKFASETNAPTWTADQIVHFSWNVTSRSWPFGTSMLSGLDTEFEILDDMEQNAKDYQEKQAWPFTVTQLGDGTYQPTNAELAAAKSKLQSRNVGENIITTLPSKIESGGTGGRPLTEITQILNFTKDNIIDAVMVPPISKQYNSTEASAKEMMPWALANRIRPLQRLFAFKVENEVFKPYLESLGMSVKVCPKLKWEAPDAHKDEEAEYWGMLVQSGLPQDYAWEQMGFDMDKIKKLRDEEASRQEEQMQLQKVQQMAPEQKLEQKPKPATKERYSGGKKTRLLEVPTLEERVLQIREDRCTDEGGVWKTIRGTHVCIREGESTADAFKRTTGKDLDGDFSNGKTGKDISTTSTNNKTGKDMKKIKITARQSSDYEDLSPEHKKLADKLSEITIETDGNDELAQKFIDRAEGIKPVSRRSTIDGVTYYDREDPEFEGITIGKNATKRELYKEAKKHCSHPNLKNDIYASYTADARYMVQQTCSCPRCKLFIRHTEEEDVKEW